MGEVIIAACGGAAVAGIFSVITWTLNRRAQKRDKMHSESSNVAVGVQVLLQDRLKHLAKHYIHSKLVDTEDLEDLMRMHEVYKDLGGNGYLDALMDAVKALPIGKH